MINKPAFNRAQRLREDYARRQCQRCFDAVVEQLGEAETLGEPVRVGDQVVIPVVRVEAEGQGAVQALPDAARRGPHGGSLTLSFNGAQGPPARERSKREG